MSNKTNNKTKSLKKFTNIALFERRENNRLQLRNQKTMYPLKLYKYKNYNKKNKNDEQTNIDFNNILFSFYSFQNEGNSTHSLYCKKNNNKLTTKFLFSKTSNNFNDTSFPFYITQTEPNIFNKTRNKKHTKSRNYNLIKIDKCKTSNNRNIDDFIFQKKYKTYSNLNKYSKQREEENENKNANLVNLKMCKLRAIYKDNLFNAKQYIDKTRRILKIKYNSSIKEERKKRNEEIMENQKDILVEDIKSLKNIKSLYNQYFNHKLSEYIKIMFRKRELERKYNSTLINQIYSLKKEISHLINKIRKIESEKYNIIQWLLFQIRVKEKKLVLPNYYIKILEINLYRDNKQRRTAKADIRMVYPPKKAKSTIEKFKLSNKEQNHESDFIGVEQEEILRILKYKQNLIFETPEDFWDEIKSIENKNIKLFSQSDILYSEIKKLKAQYYKIMSEKLHYDSLFVKNIQNIELELEETKKRHRTLLKMINDYKTNQKKIEDNKNKKINTEPNINEDYLNELAFKLNPKKFKLYTTIEKLYITCQEIEIKKEDYLMMNNNPLFENKTKEEELLQMLEFIEIRITYLLNIFTIYKDPLNPNYELIRKLRNNLMRKRKIEKAELTKIENLIKYKKLITKVNNRNNKLLFLQNRKIDMNNYAEWINGNKKDKKHKKNIFYLPTFEDFLFDNE
jgi:hypothetical protein